MGTRVLISCGALIVVLAAAGATNAGNPAGFTARVDNPWFPLRPGTTFVYKGVKDGQPSRLLPCLEQQVVQPHRLARVVEAVVAARELEQVGDDPSHPSRGPLERRQGS